MKAVACRVRRVVLSCVIPLIVVPFVASCSFGLTPATLGRSSATVSIAFPPSPVVSPETGNSRAIAPGANRLYLRAGAGDGSFATFGPYEVGSGTFMTKDIPAGSYEYLSILLVSGSIPPDAELKVGESATTFSLALSLPDERFLALLSGGALASFFDANSCVASGFVVRKCSIVSGKNNVISATLVPLTSRVATVRADPPSASFSCPLNDSGALRPVYFKVGALSYPEGATPFVTAIVTPSTTAGWSRVGSLYFFDETGASLGKLDVNGMLVIDKDKPETAYRTVTFENPTRGALYAYASYENALDIHLIPSALTKPLPDTPPADEAGTYVSATGKAGAAGTRTDPQTLAYAITKDESPTILLLGDVETNANLVVTRALTIKPASGVTAPRIKAASGFMNSYFTVISGGELTLQGVFLEGNSEADGPALYVSGGSATLTGGTVIRGSTNATGPGGAALVSSGTLTLDGAMIAGCASVRGGGVYVMNSGTVAIKGSSAIHQCFASEFGGGIYADNGSKVDISAADASSIMLNGAALGGGGLFLCDGATFVEGSSGWASRAAGNDAQYALPNVARRVPVTNATQLAAALTDTSIPLLIDVMNNISLPTDLLVTTECSLYSSSIMTIARSVSSVPIFVVQSGAKFSIGGSLRLDGLGTSSMPLVCVTGGLFELRDSASLVHNYNTYNSGDLGYYGGAVNVSGGQFTMYGGSLGGSGSDKNSSQCGGNVYIVGGTFTFLGGMIQYGTATVTTSVPGGGGVFVYGSALEEATFEMPADSTGRFVANSTGGCGGALALSGPKASANLAGGYIGDVGAGNFTTTYEGGGVFANVNAKVNLSGTKIMYNTAYANGGGIYIATDTTLTIDESLSAPQISQNYATNGYGGGLYLESRGSCAATDALIAVVISGNSAPLHTGSKERYPLP